MYLLFISWVFDQYNLQLYWVTANLKLFEVVVTQVTAWANGNPLFLVDFSWIYYLEKVRQLTSQYLSFWICVIYIYIYIHIFICNIYIYIYVYIPIKTFLTENMVFFKEVWPWNQFKRKNFCIISIYYLLDCRVK